MVHQQSGLLFLLLCWIAVKAENPPSISTLTKSPTNFKDGDTITLHCQASATGSSTFTYQWFATDFEGNGKDISLSRYSHQVNTGRLTIRSLNHTQDDGYFYCVAKNTAGRVRSKRLLIQVAHLEVTPNVDTSVSKSALQGAELTYEYPVVQSFPEPMITWTKGGSALSESQRISFSASGNLYIGNVEVNDVDRYRSTVQNTYTGQSFSRGPVVVSVTARNPSAILSTPYIILGPTNQVAIQGKTSSVTFECFASGRPMPTISWRRGGQQIYYQAGKFTLTAHNKRLTVHNPRKSEEGVYECRVTTTNQHKSRTANLTIIVEPTFTVQPAMANRFPQESAMFKCNATGTPTPKLPGSTTGKRLHHQPRAEFK
ncbi:Roundabout 1 [Desmophyllum pertusum]|uniref:Roundabout 1 n=1 Tax=Desmophyllum pertusum TaxID=174260 RepID=A0A9W9YHV8_9CNID|nr:Roundabout 1 [Desmophyllum pertusum]